ncbi:Nucleotide-binding universal stress protein, UspA family [Halovenus aranensis]|jgi:nucleotide-binding universal stress UspA family protein|uniref:Nucleotide-binding universal stress protein, UspA family n=1 Tax=Halovenus aranensis TaxID=890420 RepID=A0A1G8SQP0_9EURY|nr:universal stress protein [Halovenus aranensis]SDJ30930.1 Nucleotide-binding universal stress protein, UspA family [Halovenus aranensis]
MIERVLVPIDDSEMALRALRYALEVHPEAEITAYHVVGEPSGMMAEATRLALAEDIRAEAEELGAEVAAAADDMADEYDRTVTTEVAVGHPVGQILAAAEEFDAVVIGTHGGSLADRLFVGNVAEKVVRQSPVPVTVVR